MFFSNLVAAFRHLARALKPGGRLAFVCWRSLPENEWVTLPLMAALKHVAMPSGVDFDAPGPFALARRERIVNILEAAGFENVKIEPQDLRNRYGDVDAELAVGLRVGAVSHIGKANPEPRDRITEEVRSALATRLTDGQVELGSASWVVTAHAKGE